MPLFTYFFHLAEQVLCGHKHFSVAGYGQMQLEVFGWDVKHAKRWRWKGRGNEHASEPLRDDIPYLILEIRVLSSFEWLKKPV